MKILTLQNLQSRKYYLQVEDEDSRWGFYLTDGETVWDGGFDMPGGATFRVTSRKIKKLESCKHAIENGYGYPYFNQAKFSWFGQ